MHVPPSLADNACHLPDGHKHYDYEDHMVLFWRTCSSVNVRLISW
jgi:hypothetical protein